MERNIYMEDGDIIEVGMEPSVSEFYVKDEISYKLLGIESLVNEIYVDKTTCILHGISKLYILTPKAYSQIARGHLINRLTRWTVVEYRILRRKFRKVR